MSSKVLASESVFQRQLLCVCISLHPSDMGNSLSSLTAKDMGVGGGREGIRAEFSSFSTDFSKHHVFQLSKILHR